MIEAFRTGNAYVRVTNLGKADGNFSPRLAPDSGRADLARLHRLNDACSSHQIVADGSYETLVSAPEGFDTRTACAALVTDKIRHNLTLAPADCIPIVVWGLGRAAVALIHGGRRELDSGIIERTIQLMAATYGIEARDMGAYLGPGIRGKSYVMPSDVVNTLEHSGWEPHIVEVGDDQIALDTFGFAHDRLVEAGVRPENIIDCGVDTATDPHWHSHYDATRHGVPNGRNGASVMIVETQPAVTDLAS